MRRRVYLAGLAGTGLTTLAGCTAIGDLGDGLLGGDEYDIGMSRTSFDPDTYETAVGETVVWKNTSDAPHTVTAYEGGIPDEAEYFASGGYESEEAARDAWEDDFGGSFAPRDTYEHTFEVPGTYSYFCIPHELEGRHGGRMLGSVRIE